MAFRPNPVQYKQLSLFDGYQMLTPKKQKMLEDSWAPVFRNDILSKIDEEPFRKLFDEEGSASRPNSPVNVLVGAAILKQLFGLSETKLIQNINFDIRYAYALSLDSLSEDAFSIRTYERFIGKLAMHLEKTGEDLIKLTMMSLSDDLAKIMKIDKTERRMDSFMIDMSAKDMSRRELLYKAIKGFVSYLFMIEDTEGIEHMEHYTVDGDQNTVLYHCPEQYKQYRDEALLKDASQLAEKYGDRYADEKAYQVFNRIVNEQTIIDAETGLRRFRVSSDGGLDSSIAQSTTDMDATFRSKAGKNHKGYVANVEESVGKNGSLITHYDLRTNNTSDKEMLSDRIKESDVQDKKTRIVADGAYDSDEIRAAAEEKNIEVITTDMIGREVPIELGMFKMSEDGTNVITCPRGYEPEDCSYDPENGQCTATFRTSQCERCPYSQACKPKGKGARRKVTISIKRVRRAIQQSRLHGEEHSKYSRFRNGVETIPSFFRYVLNVDNMRAFTLVRNRIFFGLDVIAFNAMKIFGFRRRERVAYA